MPDRYELKTYELSRVRYFDGAYLKDDEFIDEQKYHIDRRQRHDRLLHISGICEGLEVSLVNSTTIKVTAGTAIDSSGRTILLAADKTIAVTSAYSGQIFVQIVFQEKLDAPADQNGVEGAHTRFTQDPVLSLTSVADSAGVVLGAVSISGGYAMVATTDGRTYSGLRLPGPGTTGYALRARGDAASSKFADLNCGLSIQGSLEIAENATIKGNLTAEKHVTAGSLSIAEALSVTGTSKFTGSLSVTDAIGIGTTSPHGQLHVVGDVVLGSEGYNGRFILHPRTQVNGDFLHITHDDAYGQWAWSSGIAVHRNGNVGIGNSAPTSKLHVGGDAKVDGALMIGPWVLRANTSADGKRSTLSFVFGDKIVMQVSNERNRLMVYRNVDGKNPMFYFNEDGQYGVWNPAAGL